MALFYLALVLILLFANFVIGMPSLNWLVFIGFVVGGLWPAVWAFIARNHKSRVALTKAVEHIDATSLNVRFISGYVDREHLNYLKELGCEILRSQVSGSFPECVLTNFIHFRTPGGKLVSFVSENHGRGEVINFTYVI